MRLAAGIEIGGQQMFAVEQRHPRFTAGTGRPGQLFRPLEERVVA